MCRRVRGLFPIMAEKKGVPDTLTGLKPGSASFPGFAAHRASVRWAVFLRRLR